jgi:hypothetical protein
MYRHCRTVVARQPPATAESPAGLGDILSSHQHLPGHDMHRADSR